VKSSSCDFPENIPVGFESIPDVLRVLFLEFCLTLRLVYAIARVYF
jgi:hypothetical protein